MVDKISQKLGEILKLKQQVRETAERIKSDGDLTPEARRRKLDELRQMANQKLDELREQYRQAVAEAREQAYQAVFGYQAGWGETPGERQRYLQLLSQAGEMNEVGLRRLLDNARLAGDNLAVKAILREAHTRNLVSVVNDCLAISPGLAAGYQRLLEFEQNYGSQRPADAKFGERILLAAINV